MNKEVTFTVPTAWLAVVVLMIILAVWTWGVQYIFKCWISPWLHAKFGANWIGVHASGRQNHISESGLNDLMLTLSLFAYAGMGVLIYRTWNTGLTSELSIGVAILLTFLLVFFSFYAVTGEEDGNDLVTTFEYFPIWLVITPILTVITLCWYFTTPMKRPSSTNYPLRHR